jgi:hypothetical protein
MSNGRLVELFRGTKEEQFLPEIEIEELLRRLMAPKQPMAACCRLG